MGIDHRDDSDTGPAVNLDVATRDGPMSPRVACARGDGLVERRVVQDLRDREAPLVTTFTYR